MGLFKKKPAPKTKEQEAAQLETNRANRREEFAMGKRKSPENVVAGEKRKRTKFGGFGTLENTALTSRKEAKMELSRSEQDYAHELNKLEMEMGQLFLTLVDENSNKTNPEIHAANEIKYMRAEAMARLNEKYGKTADYSHIKKY